MRRATILYGVVIRNGQIDGLATYKMRCAMRASKERLKAIQEREAARVRASLPMTAQGALDKARALWGPAAEIYDRLTRNADLRIRQPEVFHRTDKWVGCAEFRDHNGKHIYGNGDTWEAAFADAAERQRGMIR